MVGARAVPRTGEGIAYLWLNVWGRSGRRFVPILGIGPQSAYKAARRGRAHRIERDRLVR